MKSIFLRVFFLTIFIEACNPKAEEGNPRLSEDLQPPNKTSLSDLPDEQKPKRFRLGAESAPEIISLVSQSQNGVDPPYRVELPKLRNEDGEVILDAQGNLSNPWKRRFLQFYDYSFEIKMGILRNVIGKIFQPFFTTKPTGQGTGLGLSLSYDIIKSYQGEVSVNSKTGEHSGTVFTIFLTTKPKAST